MSRIYILYVTCENNEAAMNLASVMVNEELVACANVIGGVKSLYRWEGTLHMDDEFSIIMKVSEDVLPAAMDRLKALHHYEVPAITAWPVEVGNPDFLDWVRSITHRPLA